MKIQELDKVRALFVPLATHRVLIGIIDLHEISKRAAWRDPAYDTGMAR